MATLHAALVTTDAVLALLSADGSLVGDGTVPAAGGWQGTPGESGFEAYTILFPIGGGMTTGTLRNPDEVAASVYQLSCVGATRRQAEWLADHHRNVLLATPLTVTGRKVMLVRFEAFLGTMREDVVGQPPIFQTVDRYRIW